MYGVRGLAGRRGLGWFDVGSPTACGFTDLGVLKPACWATTLGVTSTPQNYVAAQNTLAQEQAGVPLPSTPMPAVPAAPSGTGTPSSYSDTMLPGTLAEQALTQTQANNQQFFNDLANSLGLNEQNNPSPENGGLSLTAIIAIGLGLGAVLLFSGSGRRRR